MNIRRVLSLVLIVAMLFAMNSIGTVEAVPAQTDSQMEKKYTAQQPFLMIL